MVKTKLTTEYVIRRIFFNTPVVEKKVQRYKNAAASVATKDDMEIPWDATVYINDSDCIFWMLGAFCCEIKGGIGGEMKQFFL